MRHPLPLGATALAAALLAGGCGSSSKSTSTAAGAAPASTQAPSTPASAPASTTPAVLVSTKHNKLGTVLAAGPKKLTVYLFEADKGSASACSEACAQVWPPVTGTGNPKTGGGAMVADLGTITRPDGTKQVTYKGHPLYFYIKDKDNGDAYGQGIKSFGAGWYVLAPTGNKIDHS